MQTPSEILTCIYKELYPNKNLINLNQENFEDEELINFQIAHSFIKFCINEYALYNKYNEYILTISSIMYMLKCKEEIILMQIMENNFWEEFEIIQECFWDIDKEINKEEKPAEELIAINDALNTVNYIDFFFKESEIKEALIKQKVTDSVKSPQIKFKDNKSINELNPFRKISSSDCENNSSNKSTLNPFNQDKLNATPKISNLIHPIKTLNSADKTPQSKKLLKISDPFVTINSPFGQKSTESKNNKVKEQLAELTPIKNCMLSPNHLFFSNIQKLNFSSSATKNNNSNLRNRSESFISTTTGENMKIDYENLPNKNLFLNTNYDVSLFVQNNESDSKLKLSSFDSIDKAENEDSFVLENQASKECSLNLAKDDDDNETAVRSLSKATAVKNKKISLLKNKRKKYSNKHLFSVANRNAKAKFFDEDKQMQIEEEKENDFAYANANKKNFVINNEIIENNTFVGLEKETKNYNNNNNIPIKSKQKIKMRKFFNKTKNNNIIIYNEEVAGNNFI